MPGLLSCKGRELLERGEFACGRNVGQTIGPPSGHLPAQGARIEHCEAFPVHLGKRFEQILGVIVQRVDRPTPAAEDRQQQTGCAGRTTARATRLRRSACPAGYADSIRMVE